MDFETLITRGDLPLIFVDATGNVTSINEQFTAAHGWTADMLVGNNLTLIIPEPLRDTHHMGFSRFLDTGVGVVLGQPLDLEILHPDGTTVVAEHLIIAGMINNERVIVASITNKE